MRTLFCILDAIRFAHPRCELGHTSQMHPVRIPDAFVVCSFVSHPRCPPCLFFKSFSIACIPDVTRVFNRHFTCARRSSKVELLYFLMSHCHVISLFRSFLKILCIHSFFFYRFGIVVCVTFMEWRNVEKLFSMCLMYTPIVHGVCVVNGLPL